MSKRGVKGGHLKLAAQEDKTQQVSRAEASWSSSASSASWSSSASGASRMLGVKEVESGESSPHVEVEDGDSAAGSSAGDSECGSAAAVRPRRYVSVFTAAALISSWNSTSTMMNMPFIFGVLGTLGGALFVLLIQGSAFVVARHMITLVSHFNSEACVVRGEAGEVRMFPQLGERLGGRAGRRLFTFTQMTNQLGFLPYAVTLIVASLQSLFPRAAWLACNGWACLLVLALGYVMVQLSRDWRDSSALAAVTWLLAAGLGAMLLGFCVHSDAAEFPLGGPTPLLVGQPFELFANCSGTCFEAGEQYAFLNVLSAVNGIVFSFAPAFIVAELMAEMREPRREMTRALSVSYAFTTTLYITLGVTFSSLWGNQIPLPVTRLLPQGSAWSTVASLIIIVAMVTDFFIGIVVVNRYVVARFRPDFDYRWTWRNARLWATATFLPATVTFAVTLFVPSLSAMIGLVVAFAIPWASLVLPVVFLLPAAYGLAPAARLGAAQLGPLRLAPLQTLHFTLCVIFGVLVSAASIYSVVHGLIELDMSGDYWCAMVASL